MKCLICKHEQGYGWVENEYKEINPGEDEFIQIKGNFTINKEGCEGYDIIVEVYLYGCPKCKAVIFDCE